MISYKSSFYNNNIENYNIKKKDSILLFANEIKRYKIWFEQTIIRF